METKPHKKLLVWQKAIAVTEEIYCLTEWFPAEEKYGLAQQMRRAAVSIASNIAEGAARLSDKEKLQFFAMSRGSLSELDTQLEIARRMRFQGETDLTKLLGDLEEVSRMLNGLIRKKKSSLFGFVVYFIAASLLASSLLYAGVGTTGGQFLKITPSARAAGMADAFAAKADDVFALQSNPAGLAQLGKAEFAATYLRYFGDVNFGFIGYASQVRDLGVLGFGYTYLLVADIDKRDVNEAKLGSFNAKDTALTIAYGKKNAAPSLIENLDVGASLKVISSEIDQTIAYTAAADVAAIYRASARLSTTLLLQNISPGIKFKEVTDRLPLNLKMGIDYQASDKLAAGLQIDEYLFDNKAYASLGAEYWPVRQLALRAGYRFGYDTASLGSTVGLSAGMGFRIWSVGLDYAFVPYGDLGDAHRFTFVARF